jgi:medium-chain acyl-[acyl-carrier-protein] hydrolase
MHSTYKERHLVKCYEVDAMKNFKASAFMNEAQELGGLHANLLGEGYKDLIKDGNVWVICRAHVIFIDPPTWGDMVSIETWHRCQDGVFSIRDYEMDSSDGRQLIIATTSWVIMNMESRRLQRPDRILGDETLRQLNPDKIAVREFCGKIKPAEGLELVQHHQIRISDIDYNLHANNARYLEWTMDCLDPEILKTSAIAEFSISFNTESTLGEIIDMYRVQTGEREFYVEGRHEDKNIFQIQIKFKEPRER